MDLGGAECRAAVHEGDTDVDFGSLAIGVSGGDAFSEGFQEAHLRFDPTSGVIARPALPEGPAIVSGGAQGFVADACRRVVFLPQSTVLADLNDRDRVAREDRAVAPARVIGTIGGHGADLFVLGDLVQQILILTENILPNTMKPLLLFVSGCAALPEGKRTFFFTPGVQDPLEVVRPSRGH